MACGNNLQLFAPGYPNTLHNIITLLSPVFVIARSSREDIDLEEVIGTDGFACTNRELMQPDGSVHTTTERYSDPPAGEHKKQTGVNTTQNGTTHICEKLQERQMPRHIIMLS